MDRTVPVKELPSQTASDPTEKRQVATNKTRLLAEINIKFCILGKTVNCIRAG